MLLLRFCFADKVKVEWELETLYIPPTYSDKGVGTTLVQYAFDYMREENANTFSLWVLAKNQHARKWTFHLQAKKGSYPSTQTAGSSTVTFTVTAPPTSIAVNVKDNATGAAITGATISGGGSGTTNSNGQVVFTGLG